MIPVTEQLRERWDLDSIFAGGSHSEAFTQRLDKLAGNLADLHKRLETGAPAGPEAATWWRETMDGIQSAGQGVMQCGSFVGCLIAQDVKDRQARLLQGRTTSLAAAFSSLMTLVEAELLKLSDEAFEQMLKDAGLEPVAFNLRERRANAKRKMDPTREILATDLAIDGYHGWSELYDTVVGKICIPVEIDGKVEELSVGQASNTFSSPDRALRTRLFEQWEKAWADNAEQTAGALNHIAGFRLSLYKHRGWANPLQEPLQINRMTEATLNAMWDAVSQGKDSIAQFYRRKAKLLGWESVNWYDQSAPFSSVSRKMSYEEAGTFVVDNFRRFSPRMADFAAQAMASRWVEAENRSGKAPGAFSTDFPEIKASRVFMTFSGTPGSVRTLAHELGHSYHSHVMMDLPPITQEYAMNVAETASTFAEMLINAAAIAQAKDKDEKLALLDAKINDSASYLMNIHARFLFETRFYEARKKGPLSIDHLNEMMETAQREGFKDSLGVYHPYFWASKLHFYATDVPFYNFPYTFGYLFSAGIYARALEEGPKFEQRYVDLLRDTGRMMVEDLAARHLGVDLTKPDFWLSGVKMAVRDVDEFLTLTE
jgi:pepF/M3 family oligoendopeptidase